MRLIKADGTTEELQLSPELTPRLKQIQALIGGYMESVMLPDGRILLCHEDGKLQKLPRNETATALAQLPGDYIVGDVVVATQEELDV